MSVDVKKISISDVDIHKVSIMQLLQDCFEKTFGIKVDQAIIKDKIDSLAYHIVNETAYAYGAFQDNNMIGFVWAYPVSSTFETVLHVAYIAVMKDAQGLGIGSLLLEIVEKTAKEIGLNKIELTVGNSNERAISFYKKNNYEAERIIMKKSFQ